MKIKFADNSVTFKITENELQCLAAGRSVEQITPIGQNSFYAAIRLKPAAYFPGKPALKLSLAQPQDGANQIWLILSAAESAIQDLAAMGQNRRGISLIEGNVKLNLQVDIFDKDGKDKSAKCC